MQKCSERDCERDAKTRGMCRKHYHYAWTHGLIPVKAHVAGHGDGEAFIRESLMVETDECIWNVKTGRTWSWLTGIKRKAA